MSDRNTSADLLQALEGVIETNERVYTVLAHCLEAQRLCRTLSPTVLEDYSGQLQSVIAAQNRMRELVATWWTMIGADQAH
jgi:hypothetical protein